MEMVTGCPAVDGGVPMAITSKMVGHKDVPTTQAHYYALSADRRRVIGEGIAVLRCSTFGVNLIP